MNNACKTAMALNLAAFTLAASPVVAALHGTPLYDVKVVGNALIASPAPGEKPLAEALRIVDSTQCQHKVVGDNRIELEGACNYLSALYHYVPPTAGDKIQVTGGFSFTRKSTSSYALVVAKAMRFYPPRAATPTPTPQLHEIPIPEQLRR